MSHSVPYKENKLVSKLAQFIRHKKTCKQFGTLLKQNNLLFLWSTIVDGWLDFDDTHALLVGDVGRRIEMSSMVQVVWVLWLNSRITSTTHLPLTPTGVFWYGYSKLVYQLTFEAPEKYGEVGPAAGPFRLPCFEL